MGSLHPEEGLELTQLNADALNANADTLFDRGWSSKWPSAVLPWATVHEMLSMANSALQAKQRAAEALLQELEQSRRKGPSDELLQRACRAEADSGCLLEELQALIQAKAELHAQRADLDRANALLMAERELLCEQLDVSPGNTNLCQELQKVLAAARRSRGLEGQLRMLARCQRELLLQLESTREDAARAAHHWQACEQAYLEALAAHGVSKPQLPPAPTAVQRLAATHASSSSSSSTAGDAPCAACGGGSSSSAAAVYAPLLQRLGSAGAAAAAAAGSTAGLMAEVLGSPPVCSGGFLPPTPPGSDFNASRPGPALLQMRRSHSLDSGLNSLTGLLDQLALGRLGSEEEDEIAAAGLEQGELDSWLLVDSDESLAAAAGGAAHAGCLHAAAPSAGAAVTAAAALLMLGGGPGAAEQLQQQLRKQLQPVQEAVEEQQQQVVADG